MGATKSLLNGFYNSKYICSGCITNKDLKKYIKKFHYVGSCNFCTSTSKVMDLSILAEYMYSKIVICYEEAQGLTNDNCDLIEDRLLSTSDILWNHDVSLNEILIHELAVTIGEKDWIEHNDWYGNILPAWDDYKVAVKTHCKKTLNCNFKIINRDERMSNLNSLNMIQDIADYFIKYKMSKTINIGEIFYRARPGRHEISISNFGAHQGTKHGRANAQGDIVLYLTNNLTTAFLEASKTNLDGTAVAFKLVEKIKLIDLTYIIDQSIFSEKYDKEEWLFDHFFYRFLARFSEGKFYIPTQYIVHHLRKNILLKNIDGIIYKSSKNSKSLNYAIWCDSEDSIQKQIEIINSYFSIQPTPHPS